MGTLILIALLVLFVAYANGANDNFKGVATLFGSGTANYPRALAWATVTTFAGSMTSLVLSEQLVKVFSGAGLVPDAVVADPVFLAAVAFGAAGTVILATVLSLPVSTTHALTGALVGAGLVLSGGNVHYAVLGSKFFLPLLASPVLAILLTGMLYPVLHWARGRLGIRRESCVCIGQKWVPVAMAGGQAALVRQGVAVETCEERYQGTVLAVTAQGAVNAAHVLSAGAVSFARGLNDTPKIVALLIAAQALEVDYAMALVGLAMALGSVLQARGVARTVGRKITEMNPGQGFTANLVTSALVILASRFGMPVSTTHVSCGSLFGLGAVTRQGRWKMVSTILLAWVGTLPLAAFLGAGGAWLFATWLT